MLNLKQMDSTTPETDLHLRLKSSQTLCCAENKPKPEQAKEAELPLVYVFNTEYT